MKLINNVQKKIINFSIKNYKESYKSFGDRDYLNIWSRNLGNLTIKKLFLNNSFFQLFKDYFFIFYKKNVSQNYSYFYNLSKIKRGDFELIENIIISFKKNNSSFDDHFSSQRLKSKKTLWYLIDLDEKHYSKNPELLNYLVILKKKKYSFLFIKIKTLLFFFWWFFKENKNFYDYEFFNCLKNACDEIKDLKIQRIFIPYEAQPFQKYLIYILKKKFPNSKIICYCHGGLPSLPIEYIPNKNISQIIVHSNVEKNILKNFFKWEKKKIFVMKSFRFINKNNVKKNFMYLPYYFILSSRLIEDINSLLKNFKLDKFEVIPHPHTFNMSCQKNIISYFEKNKLSSKNQFMILKNYVICIGVTGAILEALQNKLNVIHITINPEFELYSDFLWNNIIIEKFSDRIFIYKLKNNTNLINYSQKNYFLKFFNLYN
jgi:hypothetical protein